MAPPKRPWFRVYVEMVHDRKIRRLSPDHRWLWLTVLACARTSPVAGVLLLSDSVPYSDSDLADEAALPTEIVIDGLERLEAEGLVERDPQTEAWVVPKWMQRQFESDVSSDRVAKHRSIKREGTVPSPDDVTPISRARTTESETEKPLPPQTPPTRGGILNEEKPRSRRRRTSRGSQQQPSRSALPAVEELGLEQPQFDPEVHRAGVTKAREALRERTVEDHEGWNQDEPF